MTVKLLFARIILSLLLVMACFPFAFPQGQWTWMNGKDTPEHMPEYGIKGVANKDYSPGSRYEAAEWTDKNGFFWLFGGTSEFGFSYSDLWRYNPNTNEWSWIHGPDFTSHQGIYGTKKIPNPDNFPGSRTWGIATWVDNNNNLWLFGGYGLDKNGNLGYLNDLWMYNIATNEWTWISGSSENSQSGIYGNKKVSSSLNSPGSREETCTWVDNANNLWLFGGLGVDINGYQGELNDLWKFNISTQEWTWVSGDNTIDQVDNYGVKGVANSANKPGARMAYFSWKDQEGKLWLLGGWRQNSPTSISVVNDLWNYDIDKDVWTWMSGMDGNDTHYGTMCKADELNNLPARCENRARWVDDCGNFWLYGGMDMTFSYSNQMSDMWMYNVKDNVWTWVGGSSIPNQLAYHGTKGITSSSNTPGSRIGSIGWKDKSGMFWLYGGSNEAIFSSFDDVWKYVPEEPTVAYSYTVDGCFIQFNNESQASCGVIKSYYWDFGDGSYSTDKNPNHHFSADNSYDVKLIVSNCSGIKDSSTTSIYIPLLTVDLGEDREINHGENAMLEAVSDASNLTYIWKSSAQVSCGSCQVINIMPEVNSTYYVNVIDGSGCSAIDSITVSVLNFSPLYIPNSFTPNNDNRNDVFKVEGETKIVADFSLYIFDRWGEVVFKTDQLNRGWDGTYNGKQVPTGLYICKVDYKYDTIFEKNKEHKIIESVMLIR